MSLKFSFKFLSSLLLLLMIVGVNPIISAQKSVEEQLKKEITKILRYEIEWKKKLTPGFTIVIVEPDTSFTVSFGTEIGSKEELSTDRIFGIGGLSKVYSSIALAYAISQDKIDTTALAKDIFPELNQPAYNFTILDIVHHKAGFPRVFKGLNVGRTNDYEKVTEMEFLHTIYENPLSEESTFIYNHSDYAFLDIWLTKETKINLKEWYGRAQEEYKQLPDWKEEEKAIGLDKRGKIKKSIDYGIYESSLGLYATKNDLEKLIRFLQEDNPVSVFVKEGKFPTEISKKIYFSNGLYRINQGKKYTLYGHGGKSVNNSASIHFVPETNTGLVILSNSETGTNQLYLPLLSMINNNWRR